MAALHQFIPPILLRATAKKPVPVRLYASYDEALRDCDAGAYEGDDLIRMILEKTKIYSRQLAVEASMQVDIRQLSLANAILSLGQPVVRVIDFGGSCGAHFFQVRKLLPSSVRLQYIVVETPTMVKYASPEMSGEELSFESDVVAAARRLETVDLVYSSGTLQSVDDPDLYLNKLLSIQAQVMLFHRLGFTLGSKDVIVVHESMMSWNGHGPLPTGFQDRLVKYPLRFQQKDRFFNMMARAYDVAYEFNDGTGVFPVNDEQLAGMGVLFTKRS